MSYINSYGQAIGPIKLYNTWIGYYNAVDAQKNNPINYISFSMNRSNMASDLTPLMAATPLLGTYQTDKGTYELVAPKNAVATVEWVKMYAALKPGEMAGIDINQYVTQDQLVNINNSIDKINYNLNNHESRIVINENKIDSLELKVELNTTNIKNNNDLINQNTNEINSIKENPFPNGVWFKCGKATDLKNNTVM